MPYPVLARQQDALTAAELEEYLRDRLGEGVLDVLDANGVITVTVAQTAYVRAALLCKDADLLAFDLFDSLFAVDRGEDGFDVVVILYSTSRGLRVLLRTRCEGGRDKPTCPTITHLYPGANWMERETWDMFGIEFSDHPGLAPRILCAENFEGWPLRKDFYLASRAAKAWPGVKDPVELDADGNPIEKIPGPGDAPGPSILDEVMAAQSKAVNAPPAPEPEPVAATAEPAAVEAEPAESSPSEEGEA